MPGTRSSARQAAKATSASPASSQTKSSPATGSKRKATSSTPSKSKKGKKNNGKKQATIEATMPNEDDGGGSKDVEMKDRLESVEEGRVKAEGNGETAMDGKGADVAVDEKAEVGNNGKEEEVADDEKGEADTNSKTKEEDSKENGFDKIMNKDPEPKESTPEGTGSKVAPADNAVESSPKREEETPSTILEKGLIYFFFRGRVGIEDPSSVSDIARSYIVLRPLPHGAKLTSGPIGDEGTNRLLALPKKVLPVGPKDRFMTFVEKANTTIDDIKSQLSSSDYATKTTGTRHTPAASPVGEGVYAITQTGRDTHLAYILTIPSSPGDIQESIGLRQQGSFLTSAKNPTAPGPASANLPTGAEYPQEILDEFHGRGWMPLQPRLLDFANTQFLLIGHRGDGLEKATMEVKGGEGEGKGEGKMEPGEEMEVLGEEDGRRVEGLRGDGAVFVDLGLSVREFEGVRTTW